MKHLYLLLGGMASRWITKQDYDYYIHLFPEATTCYHSSLDREGQSNENLKTSCMLLNMLKMVSCTFVFRENVQSIYLVENHPIKQ